MSLSHIFELPLSRSSLGQLFRFRLRACQLPMEMGRRHSQAHVAHVWPHCDGVMWGMRGTWSSNIRSFCIFSAAMVRSMQILCPPCACLCGTKTRKEMPPAYCSFFLKMLALVMHYRHEILLRPISLAGAAWTKCNLCADLFQVITSGITEKATQKNVFEVAVAC